MAQTNCLVFTASPEMGCSYFLLEYPASLVGHSAYADIIKF